LAHLLRKGEKIVTSKESGKRILESTTGEKRRCIFSAKDVAKMYGCKAAEKKEIEKIVKN
jgi:hypothetical protein